MEKLKHAHIDTDLLELGDRRVLHPQRHAVSPNGMVSTAHYAATEAGSRMLEQKGNAVDAAIASAFALGVCEPAASGLGGQTMMLMYVAKTGQTIAIDGSSRAPNRATPDLLGALQRRRGYCATTVPSTPAVLHYVQKKYGKLKFAAVLEPAIDLAENGYQVTPLQFALTKREVKFLREGTASQFFLKDGTRPHAIGTTFKQPVLAATLRRISSKGVEEFYSGKIAKLIHEDMRRHGGLIDRHDLAQIPWPVERKPITCRFAGSRVFTFPLPGAGRTLLEMLNIYEHLPTRYKQIDTPQWAVALASVIRRAFLDRQDRPFDPNLFPQVSEERMLKEDYAQLVAKQITKRIRSAGETTHLSTMDRDGNAVGLTQSIERVYGSCSASPELGFLYNNYMMAFEHSDIAHPYYLRPNAVPWASVAPTILFRGRRPFAVLGSPGSERITSSLFQVLLRLQDHTPYSAVSAPRLHCSLKGKVSIEATRFRDDVPRALAKVGFELDYREPYSFYMGCVQLVIRDKDQFIGVADERRDGSAKGPA